MLAFLLFLASIVVSFVIAISGGGGALVLLPLMILLGMDPEVAIGTMSLAGMGLVLGSVTKYKNTDKIQRQDLKFLIPVAAISSLIAPRITLAVPEDLLVPIIAALILFSSIFLVAKPKVGVDKKAVKTNKKLGYFLYGVLVMINIAFAAGLGPITNMIFILLLGYTYLETIATRRAIGLVVVPIQVAGFAVAGLVDWSVGSAMAAGFIIGSYYGTQVAIKRGEKFTRLFFIAASIVLAVSMIIKLLV